MLQQSFERFILTFRKFGYTVKTCYHWSTPDVNKADHSPGQQPGFSNDVMSLLSAPDTQTKKGLFELLGFFYILTI